MDVKKQREFFDKVAKEIGIRNWQDWTRVTNGLKDYINSHFPLERITERGGYGLLQFFEGDLNKALKSAYPEHPWETFLPEKPTQYILNDKKYHKDLIERAGPKVGVKELDDWYQVR